MLPGLLAIAVLLACTNPAPAVRIKNTVPPMDSNDSICELSARTTKAPKWGRTYAGVPPPRVEDARHLGSTIALVGSIEPPPSRGAEAHAEVQAAGAGATLTVVAADAQRIIGGHVAAARYQSDPVGLLFRYETFPFGGERTIEYAIVHRGDELIVYRGAKDDCSVYGDYIVELRFQLVSGAQVTARDATP